MMTTTATVIPRAMSASGGRAAEMASPAATSGECPAGVRTSSAKGTCCSAMMMAMPAVNPSMTGHGM